MSILIDKLKDFDYYVKKCPLYLQNSDGFIEHFRIWYDFLITQEKAGEEVLNLINIFDPEYEDKYISGDIPLATSMLENLGSIFNISHNFSVNYGEGDVQLELTDSEFLILLKAQILKNYSLGSYEQMKELYSKLGWTIVYVNNTPADVTVNYVTLVEVPAQVPLTPNLEECWKAGLLTIQSMGINYRYVVSSFDTIALWDVSRWDMEVWGL